jgi:hypothetical protein
MATQTAFQTEVDTVVPLLATVAEDHTVASVEAPAVQEATRCRILEQV